MHFDMTCIHDFQINTTPMNAQEAREKLNEACSFSVEKEIDVLIKNAIEKKTDVVYAVTPILATAYNKKALNNYLTKNGFYNIKIEQHTIENDYRDEEPVYLLKVYFCF